LTKPIWIYPAPVNVPILKLSVFAFQKFTKKMSHFSRSRSTLDTTGK
jgi:hypothetical protein